MVRTIVPLVAGIGKMPKKTFRIYNIIGAIIWTTSLILAAYWVGGKVDNVDKYLVYLLILAILVTTGGEAIFLLRSKDSRKNFRKALLEEWHYLFRGKG